MRLPSSRRFGALLIGAAVLVAITGCRLDMYLLPQRWNLDDAPLPPWFFEPVGMAWNFGLPLTVLVLLAAGALLVLRGRAS